MRMNRGPMMEEVTEDPSITLNRCFAATVIVSATITKVNPGIATMSMPPECHYGVELANVTELRGKLPSGRLTMIIIGNAQPVQNKEVILFGCYQESHFAFEGEITENVDEVKKQVESNPIGWKDGVSPFETPFKGGLKIPADFVCKKTQWPAFKSTGDFSFSVEQIIPKDVHEYENPYGDGKFTIKIKNLKNEAQIMPCLFAKEGKILIESSIFAMVGDAAHIWPGSDMQGAEQVQFGANEEKMLEIDTLKIKTIDWPNGGSRVYFKFVLGNMIAENFFYFYSACHDKLVGRV